MRPAHGQPVSQADEAVLQDPDRGQGIRIQTADVSDDLDQNAVFSLNGHKSGSSRSPVEEKKREEEKRREKKRKQRIPPAEKKPQG